MTLLITVFAAIIVTVKWYNRKDVSMQLGMLCFMFWGASYSVTKSLFGIRIALDELPPFISRPLSPFLRMEAYALLSLPLILIPFKHDLRIPKWLGYALYPAHLVLLIILKAIMGV